MRNRRAALAAVAFAAALFAGPALATFPGKSGRIAYTAIKNGLPTLFLTGSGALTPHTAWYYDFEPAVSPDGSQIAFARLAGGSRNVLVIRPDGTGLHGVVDATTFGDGAQLSNPAWSSDGKRLSFEVASPNSNRGIWTLEAGQLTHTITGLNRREPNWSPTANEMVYVCEFRDTVGLDLCVYDADSGVIRQIPIDPAAADPAYHAPFDPDWTPDGKKIVFSLSYSTGGAAHPVARIDIFEVDARGGGLTRLTDSGPDLCPGSSRGAARFIYQYPSPSPDGKSIVTLVRDQGVYDPSTWCAAQQRAPGRAYLGTFSANGGTITPVQTTGDADPDPGFGGDWVAGYGTSWEPVAFDLLVRIDDGHRNPLAGLKLELRTLAGTIVNDDPVRISASYGYGFDGVQPGDYRLRATLIDAVADPGQPPAFEIAHYPIPDAVWAERLVHVGPGKTQFDFHFDDSAGLAAASVDPDDRVRLDDMANIYFRTRQFVDWVHENLTPGTTGATVRFFTFADTDPHTGDPVDPEDASYYHPDLEVVFGSRFSEYEERDGVPDPLHGEHAPENGEWHEYAHHLFGTYIDPSGSCAEPNHQGYRNASSCDSLNEGFSVFLATLAGQALEGDTDYAIFGSIEANRKAWELRASDRRSDEDFAVASLLWDLVDANADDEIARVIAQSGSYTPTTYSDGESSSLESLWIHMTLARPANVWELRRALAGPSPTPTEDLDNDGIPDVAAIDEVFLMHGFFPIATEQSNPTALHPGHHYDVGEAQQVNPAYPRNYFVGQSDHREYDTSGAIVQTRIPRLHTPLDRNANMELYVRDAAGRPLSGATAELTIHYPEGTETSQRRLGSGDGALVHLELPTYFDYLLPDDAPLPPCDPTTDHRVMVDVTATVNGFTTPDTQSFDNCTYQQAIANATAPGALTLTIDFPQSDSAPPVTTHAQTASQPTAGGAATESWGVSLWCADPVVDDFAAGCLRIEYRIDGGPLAPYGGPFTVAGEGTHLVEFHSVDGAGNAEPFQSLTLQIIADPDSDGDGVPDGLEIERGTNPLASDTDGDGLTDGEELSLGTDPLSVDSDYDGLSDGDEVHLHGTNPLLQDTDLDGVSDGQELANGTDPVTPDSDGDGLTDLLEQYYRSDPLDPDSDADGLDDGAEVVAGTNPLGTDSDGDGVPDSSDGCPLRVNPGQEDQDDDGVGDACDLDSDGDGYLDGFRGATWTLVGITDDEYAATPASLFEIDTANGAATPIMTLGHGGPGEAIGFNPEDGLLYHSSGYPRTGGDPVWESIDVASRAIVASGPLSGDIGVSVTGMAFSPATGRFLVCDQYQEFFDATLAGVTSYTTTPYQFISRGLLGLAFRGDALYGANAFEKRLERLSPGGASIGVVAVTLDGAPVVPNALATHPVTGELWAILGEPGFPQSLGLVDPDTGVATRVGPLPDRFAAIVFLPEPPQTAALGAAILALALCAMHRRSDPRWRRASTIRAKATGLQHVPGLAECPLSVVG